MPSNKTKLLNMMRGRKEVDTDKNKIIEDNFISSKNIEEPQNNKASSMFPTEIDEDFVIDLNQHVEESKNNLDQIDMPEFGIDDDLIDEKICKDNKIEKEKLAKLELIKLAKEKQTNQDIEEEKTKQDKIKKDQAEQYREDKIKKEQNEKEKELIKREKEQNEKEELLAKQFKEIADKQKIDKINQEKIGQSNQLKEDKLKEDKLKEEQLQEEADQEKDRQEYIKEDKKIVQRGRHPMVKDKINKNINNEQMEEIQSNFDELKHILAIGLINEARKCKITTNNLPEQILDPIWDYILNKLEK